MSNLTSVGVVAGVPTSGTGTVSTLDGIFDATNGPVAIKAASTAPVTTDKAMVVALHPLSSNPNSQAVMANSAPVVIASDQTAVATKLQATTTGGLTELGIVTTAIAVVGNVKSSAGHLYKVEVSNNSASWVYLKLYNTAGTPTAGAGTPQRRIGIPPSSTLLTTSDIGGVYSTGIGYAITGAAADADTTAVAAGILVNFHSK